MKPCEECPRPGRKVKCCSARLCDVCSDLHAHPELLTVDPRAWRKANAPEEDMTPAVIAGLLTIPRISMAWQAKKRGGVRAGKTALRVADVLAVVAPEGRLLGVELKGTHPPACKCSSCEGQREWGRALEAAGGWYLSNQRNPEEVIETTKRVLAKGGTK